MQELSSLSSEDISAKNGRQTLEIVLKRLSSGVAQAYDGELEGKDLPDRLEVLMGHLAEQDFSPEAEVSGSAITIRLLNCPFRSVALQNKAVCGYDYSLTSSMLGLDVQRDNCICDGDTGCTYTADVGAGGQRELVPSPTA